jgi:hypothetical protein
MTDPEKNDFEQASLKPRANIVRELGGFIKERRKWWLLPLLLAILLLGILILLSGTGLAPFIYTLF